ncbi:phospholipase A2-like [Ceratina calcarata]|uniref:Phospholipase A2 n=1 Tax=Ceratina calcarata TaxID=156304 RepID=A0AAJ7RW23_9HYME|nr:phospholipase A2-like [Ceratina calcarata]
MNVLSSYVLALCLFIRVSVHVHAWTISYRDDIDNEVDREELERMQLIFPGTKWCGSGNNAEGPQDLGKFKQTDACCRDHDMCSDIIEAGQTKHNLTNTSFYTRLNCKCDEKFYHCLSKSKDNGSKPVKFTYFTVLHTQCYQKDYPIVRCKRKTFIPPRRCLEYELDKNKPMKYQWFDVPTAAMRSR